MSQFRTKSGVPIEALIIRAMLTDDYVTVATTTRFVLTPARLLTDRLLAVPGAAVRAVMCASLCDASTPTSRGRAA